MKRARALMGHEGPVLADTSVDGGIDIGKQADLLDWLTPIIDGKVPTGGASLVGKGGGMGGGHMM